MESNTKPTRGGSRPGAGRKILYDEKMTPITVRLPQHYVGALRALGEGNLSLGIRRLFELHFKEQA